MPQSTDQNKTRISALYEAQRSVARIDDPSGEKTISLARRTVKFIRQSADESLHQECADEALGFATSVCGAFDEDEVNEIFTRAEAFAAFLAPASTDAKQELPQ